MYDQTLSSLIDPYNTEQYSTSDSYLKNEGIFDDVQEGMTRQNESLPNFENSMKENVIVSRSSQSSLENIPKIYIRTRLFSKDANLKKLKSKFFKYVYERMKELIKPNKRITKINHTMINNVAKNFNKELFEKTLEKLYNDQSSMLTSSDSYRELTVNQLNYEKLKNICRMKLSQLFIEYLSSHRFQDDLKSVLRKLKDFKDEDKSQYSQVYENNAFNYMKELELFLL
jgi:hypothetical protein